MDKARIVSADVIRQLVDARQSRGWSIEALADAADLHRTSVGLIERGRRGVSLPVAVRLASALDLRLSDVLRQAEQRADVIAQTEHSSGSGA